MLLSTCTRRVSPRTHLNPHLSHWHVCRSPPRLHPDLVFLAGQHRCWEGRLQPGLVCHCALPGLACRRAGLLGEQRGKWHWRLAGWPAWAHAARCAHALHCAALCWLCSKMALQARHSSCVAIAPAWPCASEALLLVHSWGRAGPQWPAHMWQPSHSVCNAAGGLSDLLTECYAWPLQETAEYAPDNWNDVTYTASTRTSAICTAWSELRLSLWPAP